MLKAFRYLVGDKSKSSKVRRITKIKVLEGGTYSIASATFHINRSVHGHII